MNKNIMVLLFGIMILLSVSAVSASLNVGAWVENNSTTLRINNGQTTSFTYGVQAVTVLNGKYSIALYSEGATTPLYTYVNNQPTVNNGASGTISVTPTQYGNTPGFYYILVNSEDNLGKDSLKLSLTVASTQPNVITASCSVTPTTGYSPLTAQFDSQVAGGTGGYKYAWTFGDGSSDNTEVASSHTYMTAGTYSTSLKITDSSSNTVTVNCGQITVNSVIPSNTLKTACIVTPQSGTVPLIVSFVSQTSGGTEPYTYEWTFDDGSVITNSYKNILAYTYSKAGVYATSLKVTDAANNVAAATCGIVNVVTPSQTLVASCTVTPSAGYAPLGVQFISGVSGGTGPYTYKWSLGDGTTESISTGDKNYIYSNTYADVGEYVTSLEVTDSANLVAKVNCGQVDVSATPIALSGTCTVTPNSGDTPLEVQFASTITGGSGAYSYNWVFGDATTGTNPSTATHTYTESGTYATALIVTDSEDNIITIDCGQVSVNTVTPTLTASCSVTPNSGESPLNSQFTSTVTGGLGTYSYTWTFGDGTTSNNPNSVNHIYTNDGIYNTVLTITDSANNSVTTDCGQITVSEIVDTLDVACVALPNSGDAPLDVSVTSTISDGLAPYVIVYTFGQGLTGTSQTDNQVDTQYTIYDSEGTYSPSIIVTDVNGNTGSATCGDIVVGSNNNTNTVANAGGPYTGYINQPITFDASASIGSIVNYRWDFGDGTAVIDTTSPTIQHYYSKVNVYQVRLTVFDTDGYVVSARTTAKIIENRTYAPVIFNDVPDKGIVVRHLAAYGPNGDTVGPNDDLTIGITLKNEWGSKLKNVRVTASIPDLGIESRLSPFDFKNGAEYSNTLVLPLEDVIPGVYYVRVSIDSDEGVNQVKRIKYREIIVKD